MVEKNLFPYNLAVVAIFKDEARYLREWLDYHLIAGVEHFYLYNNNSTDNFAEVLAPYVAANIVTLTDLPGIAMQVPAYDDAIEKYRFECKYLAFIDLDEFIFPKTGESIFETVDEIFSREENIAAVGINWQCFGSNNLQTADYSRGVLERFTRRAPDDWTFINSDSIKDGNIYIKSIVNPRRVDYFFGPHYATYFTGMKSVNARGNETYRAGSQPIDTEKIVINHYCVKSLEEFTAKVNRADAFFTANPRRLEKFKNFDRNEVFDDGILNYRTERAKNFSAELDDDRVDRVKKSLMKILTQCSPFDMPPKFFVGKLETFLTCRALAEKFNVQISSRSAEEFALVWIYQTLLQAESLTHAEISMLIRALPEILSRPFPFCLKLKKLVQDVIIPTFCDELKVKDGFPKRSELLYIRKLLHMMIGTRD